MIIVKTIEIAPGFGKVQCQIQQNISQMLLKAEHIAAGDGSMIVQLTIRACVEKDSTKFNKIHPNAYILQLTIRACVQMPPCLRRTECFWRKRVTVFDLLHHKAKSNHRGTERSKSLVTLLRGSSMSSDQFPHISRLHISRKKIKEFIHSPP